MDANANVGIVFEGIGSLSLILTLFPVHLEEEETNKEKTPIIQYKVVLH